MLIPLKRDEKIINDVLDKYGTKSTKDIIDITKDIAWQKAFSTNESDPIIPKEDIKKVTNGNNIKPII